MPRKAETIFREAYQERLKKIPRSLFFSIQQVAIVGTPDILGVVNSYFIALELKQNIYEKARPRQAWNLAAINHCRGFAFLVSPENADAVYDFLVKVSSNKYALEVLQHDFREMHK